ncbi:MAG: N-acetyltransferase [Gemmatimonadota bacterium]|nr:N-acetyltransferase [Gemmatimonadota bacterium]
MNIEHDIAGHRFRAPLSGGTGDLTYEPRGDALDLLHTVVPAEAQGEGVGDALVRAAFDYARSVGKKIIPTCPYVRHWLEEHPEENEMVLARR